MSEENENLDGQIKICSCNLNNGNAEYSILSDEDEINDLVGEIESEGESESDTEDFSEPEESSEVKRFVVCTCNSNKGISSFVTTNTNVGTDIDPSEDQAKYCICNANDGINYYVIQKDDVVEIDLDTKYSQCVCNANEDTYSFIFTNKNTQKVLDYTIAPPNPPELIPTIPGATAKYEDLPEVATHAVAGQASWDGLFPPETSVPIEQGGVPPRRLDFNALFKTLGENIYYMQRGGIYTWQENVTYPAGAEVYFDGTTYQALFQNTNESPASGNHVWISKEIMLTEMVAAAFENNAANEIKYGSVKISDDFYTEFYGDPLLTYTSKVIRDQIDRLDERINKNEENDSLNYSTTHERIDEIDKDLYSLMGILPFRELTIDEEMELEESESEDDSLSYYLQDYDEGHIICYKKNLYQAKHDMEDVFEFIPEDWNRITLEGISEWKADEEYIVGQYVWHDGLVYRSVEKNSNELPYEGSSIWIPISYNDKLNTIQSILQRLDTIEGPEDPHYVELSQKISDLEDEDSAFYDMLDEHFEEARLNNDFAVTNIAAIKERITELEENYYKWFTIEYGTHKLLYRAVRECLDFKIENSTVTITIANKADLRTMQFEIEDGDYDENERINIVLDYNKEITWFDDYIVPVIQYMPTPVSGGTPNIVYNSNFVSFDTNTPTKFSIQNPSNKGTVGIRVTMLF